MPFLLLPCHGLLVLLYNLKVVGTFILLVVSLIYFIIIIIYFLLFTFLGTPRNLSFDSVQLPHDDAQEGAAQRLSSTTPLDACVATGADSATASIHLVCMHCNLEQLWLYGSMSHY